MVSEPVRILVVSPCFAFRGPLTVAFLASFHGRIEVFGCGLHPGIPMSELALRMLWESFLEDTRFRVISLDEAAGQRWDAVICIGNQPNEGLGILNTRQMLLLQVEELGAMADADVARRLRDQIKNDTFLLLRDRLKLKPGAP
jgi:hypothetical protein